MILSRQDRLLVWGITGKQASFWTEHMIAYGTAVVGGVNPARAGSRHLSLPVFGSGRDAAGEFDVALLFVPPAAALTAGRDAIEAGARLLVVLTEHIPIQDVMTLLALARRAGTTVVGPNTAGLVTPGQAFAGIMPAFNDRVFQPGPIGVISRSGSLGTLVCLNLTRAGLGQSAFIGIGGDALPGSATSDALTVLAHHKGTDAVVLLGEIGGKQEQEAAEIVAGMNKPVIAFLAGRAAPADRRMGHAGAIITGADDGWEAKRRLLTEAGAIVVDTPAQVPTVLAGLLTSVNETRKNRA
jgi:succinyl-CoA synthetase alpha subunit